MDENHPQIEQNNIIYLIDLNDKTASVINGRNPVREVFIPRTINYQSNQYVVKTISKISFYGSRVTSISFPPDSDIEIIEGEAFCYSTIEKLTIPSNLVELKENWCIGTSSLNRIIISPENPRYSFYDGKLIIGKSSSEIEAYDVLHFCIRSIEKVKIPSFIKQIGKYSFHECSQLRFVEIIENSELQQIDASAFEESSIERFTIPHHLTHISNDAFNNCKKLRKFNIPTNSELQTIGNFAFFRCPFESFTIPPHLTLIDISAFSNCRNLRKLEIAMNSELQIIEKHAFNFTKIEKFTIPSHLKSIGKEAFFNNHLNTVDVPENSELEFIGKYAFGFASIGSFLIPSHIKHIDDKVFAQCRQLQIIEIHENINMDNVNPKIFDDIQQAIVMASSKLSNYITSLFDSQYFT